MTEKRNLASLVIILSIIGVCIFILGGYAFLKTIPSGNNGNTHLFIDSMNRKVYVPENPQRIVSMAPSITEIIYTLGADNKLVGVTNNCNYPSEAQNKPKIGGYYSPNSEIILSLSPDLIISSRWDVEDVTQLENYGLPIVIILPDTINDIIESFGIIGNLINYRNESIELMNDLNNNLSSIETKVSTLNYSQRIDCYFEISQSPMVAGGDSYIDDMITKAGAINLFSNINQEWATVSHEIIIDADPDVIFVTEHSYPNYELNIYDRPGYNLINACINNRVYLVFDDIYLRTGPRIIMALENMTRYLYPFLFL